MADMFDLKAIGDVTGSIDESASKVVAPIVEHAVEVIITEIGQPAVYTTVLADAALHIGNIHGAEPDHSPVDDQSSATTERPFAPITQELVDRIIERDQQMGWNLQHLLDRGNEIIDDVNVHADGNTVAAATSDHADQTHDVSITPHVAYDAHVVDSDGTES